MYHFIKLAGSLPVSIQASPPPRTEAVPSSDLSALSAGVSAERCAALRRSTAPAPVEKLPDSGSHAPSQYASISHCPARLPAGKTP